MTISPLPQLRSRYRVWLLYTLIAVLSFTFGFILFNYIIMPQYVNLGDETDVPDLTGLDTQEAQQVLKQAHLDMAITKYEYDNTVPEKKVIGQLPSAGTRVKIGKKIRLTVSKGPESIFVPDLSNLNLQQAEVILKSMDLTLGEVTYVYNDRYEKDNVINNIPTPNTPVNRRTSINVMVSKGARPEYVLVPNLTGKSLEEATQILKGAGLILGNITEGSNSDFVPRSVIDQSIMPGREVIWGDTIHLVINP